MDSKTKLNFLKSEREVLEDVWAQSIALEEAHKIALKRKNKQIIYYADLIRNKDKEIEQLQKEWIRMPKEKPDLFTLQFITDKIREYEKNNNCKMSYTQKNKIAKQVYNNLLKDIDKLCGVGIE